MSATRRTMLRAVAGAGLLGVPTASAAVGSVEPTSERGGHDATATTPTCQLPVFTDEYVGFRVGRPAGWEIQYAGGIVWQTPPDGSDAFSTVGFVYPGFLQGTDIGAVADAFVAALDDALSPSGSVSLTDDDALTGSLGTAPLDGRLWTTTDGSFGLLWGGFGTAPSWAATRDLVAETGRCFERFAGEPLYVDTAAASDAFGTTTWQYVSPRQWWVSDVNSLGIDIYGERTDAGARSHVGFGFRSNRTPTTAVSAVQAWLWHVRQQGYTVRVREVWDLGTTTDELGNPCQLLAVELVRSPGSGEHPGGYRGVLTTAVTTGTTEFGTTMQWFREALPDDWDRLSGITSLIESNIAILSRRPGQGVAPPLSVAQTNSDISDIVMDTWQAQTAVDDRLQQQYVDAIWSVDRVENPADPGEQALVPISGYDPAACDAGERPVYNDVTGDVECWPLV